MRSDKDILYAQKWVICRNWFTGKNIHCCSGHLSVKNGIPEVFLNNDTTTGTVDKANPLLHLIHYLFVNHSTGGIGERHVYSNKIRLGNNILKGTNLNPHILGTFFIDIRIVADNLHFKGQCALGHTTADTAHTDDAQSLILQLHTSILLAIPLALLQCLICYWNITGHGQHHSTGMLSGCIGVTARRINNDNAAGSRCRNINIIHTYTCTAYNLQISCRIDNLCSNLGGRAYNQSIKLRNNL